MFSAAIKSGAAGNPTDPQFNYVTMLLHGDGTNGAQNNTFLDSSTNNFTITRNGNTTQGTFTPYGSNWSNYFDGSGDYLTAPNSTAFDLSTSNFTIEGFFYPTVGSAFQSIYAYASNAGASISDYAFQLLLNSSNGINFRVVASGSSSFTTISTSNTFTLNSWNYVCVTRTGTSVSVYLNGTTTTGTIASTIRNNASSILTIGRDPDGSFAITGYLSNLRILKGTAVTPSTPTTPLTAITNTSLLTCQSNRFIDNSTNNFTITKNGDTSVQRFSPFSPTTAYSTSVIGGSGYFDGSGDYLVVPNNAALNLSTADFTIECWLYFTPTGSTQFIATYNVGVASNSQYDYVFSVQNSGAVRIDNFSGSGQAFVASSALCVANAWNHIAVTRTGASATVYANGVGTTGTVYATANANSGATLKICADNDGSLNGKGYMTDFRLVKGTRVYTSNFTPPTAPLTAITNTSVLLSYTNAGILDNAMMNDLETVGNAQISTSVKKYGTGSMYFDGTGDYLTSPISSTLAFGSGNFTVECWVYATNTSALRNIIGNYNGTLSTASFVLQMESTGRITGGIYSGSSFVGPTSSASISATTWTHIALVRNGTSIKLYINGTNDGSTTSSSVANTPSGIFSVGAEQGSYAWNGYIDDLRITKGFARYTSNFTPPTAAFPNN